MTTICTDGYTIAADGRTMRGWTRASDLTKKIMVIDNVIFAGAGIAAYIEPLARWYLAGADPATYPVPTDENEGTDLLVITGIRTGFLFATGCKFSSPARFPLAIGSGWEFARMAMACGKSPYEAVQMTMDFDMATGGAIQNVEIADVLNEALKEAAE